MVRSNICFGPGVPALTEVTNRNSACALEDMLLLWGFWELLEEVGNSTFLLLWQLKAFIVAARRACAIIVNVHCLQG